MCLQGGEGGWKGGGRGPPGRGGLGVRFQGGRKKLKYRRQERQRAMRKGRLKRTEERHTPIDNGGREWDGPWLLCCLWFRECFQTHPCTPAPVTFKRLSCPPPTSRHPSSLPSSVSPPPLSSPDLPTSKLLCTSSWVIATERLDKPAKPHSPPPNLVFYCTTRFRHLQGRPDIEWPRHPS